MGDGGWINGGFFVASPLIGAYIENDASVWEREPMERLAAEGQLGVYFHDGFWQPMDTLRDRRPRRALGFREGALEDMVLSRTAAKADTLSKTATGHGSRSVGA